MIPVTDAIEIIERNTPVLGHETVSLDDAVRRVLAGDIIADTDLPPFDRSQMDGYAVIAADTTNAPVDLKIAGESAAGHGWHDRLMSGQAVRIMTGAPVPEGAEAVQKVELTSETDGTVRILETVKTETNLVRRGAEIKEGERVFCAGERITERMIASLAAFGYAEISVSRRPCVSILTTGSEIVAVDAVPGTDQIRNSNSPMLKAMAEICGARTSLVPSVVDDQESIKKTIETASKTSDILVITGGVSVGKYDLTKAALRELGAEVFFEHVRLKPGKPTVFAKLGNTLAFGLPGNPVSAAVTFYLFVRKAILLMQAAVETELRQGFAVAGSHGKAARDRDSYLPATLDTNESGCLVATPTKWIGSSDFIGFGRAEALILAPAGDRFEQGDVVRVAFL